MDDLDDQEDSKLDIDQIEIVEAAPGTPHLPFERNNEQDRRNSDASQGRSSDHVLIEG